MNTSRNGQMRVRVSYTFDAPDYFRRAINHRYGQPGLATREDVKRWLWLHGVSENDNLIWDLEAEEGRARARPSREEGKDEP